MLKRIRTGLAASAIGITFALGNTQAVAAVPVYTGLVIFGDSLSDSGNNSLVFGNDGAQNIGSNGYIPGQTYGSGTYSNGPVWATQFANNLGVLLVPSLLGGTNYAFGGSVTSPDQTYTTPGGSVTLPSLVGQASLYLGTSPTITSSTLFVVAGGGNNARAILNGYGSVVGAGGDPNAFVATNVGQYVADIGGIVDSLQAAGAQHIVVWNTPNIGLVPAVVAAGAGASFLGSSIASTMNNALALRLNGETGVQEFDLFGLIPRAAASGLFTNLADACGNTAQDCNSDLSAALFYDGIHPTTAAHAYVAGEMQLLAAVPEPSEFALLTGGLLLIGGAVRRRRAQTA